MTSVFSTIAADGKRVVLLPAAGSGSRFGAATPKQYQPLLGKTMLYWTVQAFAEAHGQGLIDALFIVSAPDDQTIQALVAAESTWQGWVTVLPVGGAARADSVQNGLNALQDQMAPDDWVLVHDAARPLLSLNSISQICRELTGDAVGGILAVPVADTLKRQQATATGDPVRIASTVGRDGLWAAQTPQMFRFGLLRESLASALAGASAAQVTDEASALEMAGYQPRLIRGESVNIKVTLASDMVLAAQILTAQIESVSMTEQAAVATASSVSAGPAVRPPFRIGQGYDCHALVPDRKLIIGGVEIAHHLGLAGHSDADVLLHAVTDALLGAVALGDIGRHFPDTDAAHKAADSRVLLRNVVGRLHAAGYRIGNIDATVIAQRPKLAPHIPLMCAHIAEDCGLPLDCVNVKAKTNEKLGYLGREEGMAAEAVALIYPV